MADKKKVVTYIGYAIFFSFIPLSLWVLFKLGTLEKSIVDMVDGYGYAAILAVSFLADMIMQPIGPDIPLVAGILIGLSPIGCLVFAIAGSIAATSLGYYLGRMYGEEGFLKFYGYVKYQKWKKKYDRYGRLLVLLAALTPIPYVPVCWLSGMFRMKFYEFFILAVGARSLRLIGVAYITMMIISI